MAANTFFRNVKHFFSSDLSAKEERSYHHLQQLTNFVYGLNNIGTWSPDYDTCNLSAMRLATVYACVLVRAESLSTLPASVKQDTEKGSIEAVDSPVYKLIKHRPNPFQTACDFWKTVSAYLDLTGNCFCLITRSGRFQPERIDILDTVSCGVEVLKSNSGECYYRHNGKTYKDYEILHFKDLSLDGYYGCSRIAWNKDTVGYAHKLKKFGNMSVGTKPNGYFSTEQSFDVVKKQEASLSEGWNSNIAAGNTPVLPFGLKYNNLQLTPGDAQYLEAVGATKEDICSIFRVPPSLIQDYARATWSNAEQQDLVFVKYTLLPMITNIEQECNYKLFPDNNYSSKKPYYVKFNVNAFMRGDFATRTQGYTTLWERGLITGNMVADLEDWNHFEGGDERFVPLNMIPLSSMNEYVKKVTNIPESKPLGGGLGQNENNQESIDDFIQRLGKKKNGNVNYAH